MKAINSLYHKNTLARKALLTLPRRAFFSQMGFDDFSETEVLMQIQNGVYTYPHWQRNRLGFDKNARLLIYDSSAHYLIPKPSSSLTALTALSTFAAFH